MLHAEVTSAGDSAAEVLYAVFFIYQTHNCVCGQFVFFPKAFFFKFEATSRVLCCGLLMFMLCHNLVEMFCFEFTLECNSIGAEELVVSAVLTASFDCLPVWCDCI